MDDKVFVDGLIVKRNDNAPEWAVCKLSVKVGEFKAFLDQHESKGWVNMEVKMSKNGKFYSELDTWEPNRQDTHDSGMAKAQEAAEPTGKASGSNDFDDDIPF
jgi:hypothetical protein